VNSEKGKRDAVQGYKVDKVQVDVAQYNLAGLE